MGNYSQAFFKEVPFWYFLQGNQNLYSTTVQVGDFLFWKQDLEKALSYPKIQSVGAFNEHPLGPPHQSWLVMNF